MRGGYTRIGPSNMQLEQLNRAQQEQDTGTGPGLQAVFKALNVLGQTPWCAWASRPHRCTHLRPLIIRSLVASRQADQLASAGGDGGGMEQAWRGRGGPAPARGATLLPPCRTCAHRVVFGVCDNREMHPARAPQDLFIPLKPRQRFGAYRRVEVVGRSRKLGSQLLVFGHFSARPLLRHSPCCAGAHTALDTRGPHCPLRRWHPHRRRRTRWSLTAAPFARRAAPRRTAPSLVTASERGHRAYGCRQSALAQL